MAEGRPPDREEIRARIAALPVSHAESPILNEEAALAAFFDLEKENAALSKSLGALVSTVLSEIEPELTQLTGNRLIMTHDELNGIVAKTAIRAAAQALYEKGGAALEVAFIRKLFGSEGGIPSPRSGSSGDDAALPPSGELPGGPS